MMSNGIISGAILSWVTIITELSTAICLYTVRTQTLTIAIYTYVSRGNDGIAAALASSPLRWSGPARSSRPGPTSWAWTAPSARAGASRS